MSLNKIKAMLDECPTDELIVLADYALYVIYRHRDYAAGVKDARYAIQEFGHENGVTEFESNEDPHD